nr:uncharacterized protein LOC128702755 [Cherax quadricarinatus]
MAKNFSHEATMRLTGQAWRSPLIIINIRYQAILRVCVYYPNPSTESPRHGGDGKRLEIRGQLPHSHSLHHIVLLHSLPSLGKTHGRTESISAETKNARNDARVL